MLSDIATINNFIAYDCKERFDFFDHIKNFLCCDAASHRFFPIREDLLTSEIIKKVRHYISEHAKPANLSEKCLQIKKMGSKVTLFVETKLYQRIVELDKREEAIKRFREALLRSGTKQRLKKLPAVYSDLLGHWELCLNEKIELLYLLTEVCCKAQIESVNFSQEFQAAFSDGANFIVHQYLQSLYHRIPFKYPHVRHLIRVIGPFVTILDCSHFFYPFNKIIPTLEKNHQNVQALFPSVKRIVLGHFRLREHEPNPIIFLGEMIDYPNRDDQESLGVDIKEEVPNEVVELITTYFPKTIYQPGENTLWKTSKLIQEKFDITFKGGHHHFSEFKTLRLCTAEQIPFIGPIQGAVEHFPTEDSALAAATAFNFVGEIAESLLRVLEISHVTGVSHLLEEVHEVFQGALSALPIIGTGLLTTSFVKHSIHLDKLVCFRSRVKGLYKRVKRVSADKKKQKIKNFLGPDFYPHNKTIKQMILSATKGIDPRLYDEAIEAISALHAKKTIKLQKERGFKEIYKGLYKAVEKNMTAQKVNSMMERMIRNLNKRIANETVLLLKTGATLGFSVTGIITPINPLVILTVLGTNVAASIGLAWNEHRLVHESFV